LTKIFGIVCIFAGIGYITKPIITSLVFQYVLKVPPVYDYVIQGDYHFDTASSPGYQIRGVTESYIIMYLVLFNVSYYLV